MKPLEKLNHIGQKISHITYELSNINAVVKYFEGDKKPLENKVKKKIKRRIIDKLL